MLFRWSIDYYFGFIDFDVQATSCLWGRSLWRPSKWTKMWRCGRLSVGTRYYTTVHFQSISKTEASIAWLLITVSLGLDPFWIRRIKWFNFFYCRTPCYFCRWLGHSTIESHLHQVMTIYEVMYFYRLEYLAAESIDMILFVTSYLTT